MKRRTFHPTPHSKIDHHIELAADRLNQGCNILIWGAAAIAVFMYSTTPEPHKAIKLAHTEQLSDISETDYLLAISYAKTAPKIKLTESQMQELDRQASLQTRPEDIVRLKPKAKAVYYATLNQKPDAFTAAGF